MMAANPAIESMVSNGVAEVPGLVSAYLFGSFANGRAHRQSDVDVGVLLSYEAYPSPADRFDIRLRLTGRLSATLKRDADVVILNDAPPQLARHIMTSGRRVFLGDAAADHATLRTVLSRAADLEPFLRRMRHLKLASLER
jgi:predicted nucleotidyltransferase